MDKFNGKEPIIKGSGDGGGGGSRGGSINALATIAHSGHCYFNARWGFGIYKVNTLHALSAMRTVPSPTHTHSLSLFRSPTLPSAARIYFD